MNFDEIFKIAKRENTPLKILLGGSSGSGKSVGALLMAYGLSLSKDWTKIICLDTEDSLSLYADNKKLGIGSFRVAKILPPYEPERAIKVIELAEKAGAEVFVLDSLTHFWSEDGGVLDIHNKYGGKFQDWAKANPRHKALFDAIKKTSMHVICTTRKKTDYSMTQENGRTKIEKVGLKNEQRDNIEYEFTCAFDININHLATTSKDRTSIFMDRTPFIINQKTGQELLDWSTNQKEVTNG